MKEINKFSILTKKNWHLIFLILICFSILVSHSLYVLKTQQYPKMDEHSYMELSVAFYRFMRADIFTSIPNIFQYLIDHPPFRQPAYPLILSFFYLLTGLGNSYRIALWLNVIFYLTTVVTIYFLGKEFLSKTASVIASLIFAFYGFSLFYLHFTYSETATTSIIILTLYFLVKSKGFTSRKYSLFFALSMLIAVLTRWIVFIFLIGPIAYSFIPILFNKKKLLPIVKNIFLIFLVLSPAIIFYLINLASLKSYVTSNIYFGPKWVVDYLNDPNLRNTFSWHSIYYYLNVFAQNTFIFYFIFIAGLLISIFKFKKYGFFLILFFVPYALLTFAATLKDDRYIVPIYPSLALISATAIDFIKFKKMKIFLVSLIILVGFCNFLAADWGVGPLGLQGLVSVSLPKPIGNIYFTTLVWPPPKDKTSAKEIIDIIERDWHGKRQPVFVSFYNNYEINNAIYTRSNYLREVQYPFGTLQAFPRKDRYVYFFQTIQKADYLLVKNRNVVDNSLPNEDLEVIQEVNKIFDLTNGKLPDEFIKLKDVFIPLDKSTITIFKKTRNLTIEDIDNFANLIIEANPELLDEIKSSLGVFSKSYSF